MRGRIRAQLTYANVISTLSLFLVLAGGTAWAVDEWTGANIQDGTLASADYKNNDIRSVDVKTDSLTGADVANQSGVDTCTHGSARFGELCVGVANEHHDWYAANALCANLELRLPTLGEAQALALNHQLPGLDDNNLEYFWTDEVWTPGANPPVAYIVNEAGAFSTAGLNDTNGETVCVTTPTN
jgi:hypothetical protein